MFIIQATDTESGITDFMKSVASDGWTSDPQKAETFSTFRAAQNALCEINQWRGDYKITAL